MLDFEVLDIFALRKCVFRIVVRDRKIIGRLADYIDASLGDQGFSADEIRRPEGFTFGLIFVSYSGDKIHRNAFGDLSRWDVSAQCDKLEEIIRYFFLECRAHGEEFPVEEAQCVVVSDKQPIDGWPDDEANSEEEIADMMEENRQHAYLLMDRLLADPRYANPRSSTSQKEDSPYHDTGDKYNSPSPL